jgi:hypothetical protein
VAAFEGWGLVKEKWLCTIFHFPPISAYASVVFQRVTCDPPSGF